MRGITIAAIPTLLLLGAAMPGSGAARSHKAIPTCLPVGAHVLLADAQAAVYTVHERRVERFAGKREAAPIIATRACDASSKRSIRLDWEYTNAGSAESRSPIPPHLTLGGPVVAYEESYSAGNRYTEGREEEYVEEWYVVVRNLRTGRIIRKVPTGEKPKDHPKRVGHGPTTAIVAKADGAVAWILDTVQSENRYQVHTLDETGEHIPAVGSNIDPTSLALAGNTVYWTQGGQSFSAPLN